MHQQACASRNNFSRPLSPHILLVDDQEGASALRLQHHGHELGVHSAHVALEWRLGNLDVVITEFGLVGRPKHMAELGVAHPADRHGRSRSFVDDSCASRPDHRTGRRPGNDLIRSQKERGGAIEHVTHCGPNHVVPRLVPAVCLDEEMLKTHSSRSSDGGSDKRSSPLIRWTVPLPRCDLAPSLQDNDRAEPQLSNCTVTPLETATPTGQPVGGAAPSAPPPHCHVLAVDCEMVGVGADDRSALARCSIVDSHGEVIYDSYVRPPLPVRTYRTKYSGIRKRHLRGAAPHRLAVQQVRDILKGCIVVGHDLRNDFSALQYWHPKALTRDTSEYAPLRLMAGTPPLSKPSLRRLSDAVLRRPIQRGSSGHCSVEDARAAMALYQMTCERWEASLQTDKDYFSDKYWELRDSPHKQRNNTV